MMKLAEPWRPWRGVAAHLLWAYYHVVKRREGAPVPAQTDSRDDSSSENEKGERRMAAELDGPRLEPRSGQAKRLVVFLHGYGADGNDLIDIGRAWQGMLPDTAFVSPHAPRALRAGADGPAMVPAHLPRSERALERRATRPAPVLEQFLDAELARRKLPPSALALVGFSQGTMMALHVGLRRAAAPAAIVGYSGMFVLPDDADAGRGRRRDQVASRRCC